MLNFRWLAWQQTYSPKKLMTNYSLYPLMQSWKKILSSRLTTLSSLTTIYSDLKEFTGFAVADFIDLYPTVSNAMDIVAPDAIKKIDGPISSL